MVPPSLCILASSVCKSLQCLISALTQGAEVVTYLGSRVQLHYGEGGTLRANITGVCGSARSAWTTPGLPPLTAVCAFPAYTAQALLGYCPERALRFVHFPGLSCSGSGSWVLCKCTDLVGHAFCAPPRSKQLRWPGAWRAHCPRWTVCLNHLPSPGTWFPKCATRALSQVCHVPPLGSWSQAVTLLAYVNRPGSQEDLVSYWGPAHSLVEDAGSGAEIAPRPPALAVVHLPLCLWWGKGPVRSQLALLWYSLNPLFCEWVRLHLMLELYTGKFSLFFLSLSLAIPQFGLLSHVSSLRLSSGHSGLVVTLSVQPAPSCPAPASWW